MQYRPTAQEIVDSVAGFLEDQLLPAVRADVKHDVRVAAHLLRVVGRELTDGGQTSLQERERLSSLLGRVDADLMSLRLELSRRLLDPQPLDATATQAIFAALVHTAREDLAICKPGYDDWALEIPA